MGSTPPPTLTLIGLDHVVGLDVVFRGEHAVGKEGPYRQLFMDICHELMDEELMGLLMKAPIRVRVRVGRYVPITK